MIFLIVISYSLSKPQNKITTEITIEEQLKKQKNYQEQNLKRYLNYYKNHNLKLEDIILYVNIGIDFDFYQNIIESKELNKPTIIVNKYIKLPSTYTPKNLEKINKEFSSKEILLEKTTKLNFENLAKDAKNNNLNIIAISGYRSYDYQTNLYNNYLKKDSKNNVDTYSARPGHSEHQTGLAIDISNNQVPYTQFDTTKEYLWLEENSYKYGFIIRYPKYKEHITGYNYEPWHIRYVGYEIAEYIMKNNITYEEYYYTFLNKKM